MILVATLLLLSPNAVFPVPVNNTELLGFVPSPTGRGTLDILRSCLVTLVICLWTCLHLNLPPPASTALGNLRRRLKWMAITAIAPEYVAALAINEFFIARRGVREINGLPQMSTLSNGWTMTDVFYANMGGYVLQIPDHPGVAIDTKQIIFLVKNAHIALPPSNHRLIEDMSKADAIAKALACIQTLSSACTTASSADDTRIDHSCICLLHNHHIYAPLVQAAGCTSVQRNSFVV